ncbi:Uncharacterised protein [Mycobacteroides abscessus]|nr:Uncharacterised protein [Mycobacteroides abscessus]CPU62797.1 Uncharacterised protein [Mycobacteroides abscessus]SKQ36259.1 Uncharacterised protein [Mycobacteroides abscessus subsp. massiliense]SKW96448.1 Uncharacterised protein [Mycobacteroides abscessus subsp. massiliense]
MDSHLASPLGSWLTVHGMFAGDCFAPRPYIPSRQKSICVQQGTSATICRWHSPECDSARRPLTITLSSSRWPAMPALSKTGHFLTPVTAKCSNCSHLLASCRSLPRITARSLSVRCGRTIAIRHCALMRPGRHCRNSASLSHQARGEPASAACFWMHCSPSFRHMQKQCALMSMFAIRPNICTSARDFAWWAKAMDPSASL